MQFQNHIKWCLYFRAKTFRKKTGGIGYVEKPATFFYLSPTILGNITKVCQTNLVHKINGVAFSRSVSFCRDYN